MIAILSFGFGLYRRYDGCQILFFVVNMRRSARGVTREDMRDSRHDDVNQT
jgi:hypothetical protein